MTQRIVHPQQTRCEMTQIVLPGDCNALDTAFGGKVMSWVDVCAAVACQRFARGTVVTARPAGHWVGFTTTIKCIFVIAMALPNKNLVIFIANLELILYRSISFG